MISGRFFDTNILVYAHTNGDPRSDLARALLAEGGSIGVQALNEFTSIARTKLRFTWKQVDAAIQNILTLCPNPKPLSVDIHQRARQVSERYGLSIWDGLMVAAAIEARCAKLLTEDLQHRQIIEGLRIENPFRAQ